jgi:hypothetical protein
MGIIRSIVKRSLKIILLIVIELNMSSPQSPAEKNRSAVAKHYETHKDDVLRKKAEARLAKGKGITKATAEKFGLEMPSKPEDPRVVKMSEWMFENKSQSTAKMYVGQLKRAIMGANSDEVADLMKWIGLNVTNPNTQRTCLQALLCYSGEDEQVLAAYQAADEAATEYGIQRSFEEEVMPFNIIKEKVFEHFPESSDQRLYMELYELVPTRDDLGNVELCSKEHKPTSENWLRMDSRELHIGKHKTVGKYSSIHVKLPKKLMEMIPTDRKFLFEKTEGKALGSMSKFVGDMLKTCGAHDKGSINYLRHSYASTELSGSKVKDTEKRRELFCRMMHSPLTQLKYLRTLQEVA